MSLSTLQPLNRTAALKGRSKNLNPKLNPKPTPKRNLKLPPKLQLFDKTAALKGLLFPDKGPECIVVVAYVSICLCVHVSVCGRLFSVPFPMFTRFVSFSLERCLS